MYNPEVMKQAQEMMAKMTPAQREKMMEMQRNMSPEMLQAAQRNMASMNPDMMKQAMQGGNFERSLEQMENMSPEEMERRTSAVDAHTIRWHVADGLRPGDAAIARGDRTPRC